jgi:hypothetical protein
VPVFPAPGSTHEKVGPAVCTIDTKVVLSGTGFLSSTLVAASGPLLATSSVKAILPPAGALETPPNLLTSTERSVAALAGSLTLKNASERSPASSEAMVLILHVPRVLRVDSPKTIVAEFGISNESLCGLAAE